LESRRSSDAIWMISAVGPFSQNAWIEMRGMGRARRAAGGARPAVSSSASGAPTPTASSGVGMGLALLVMNDVAPPESLLVGVSVHTLVDALACAGRLTGDVLAPHLIAALASACRFAAGAEQIGR